MSAPDGSPGNPQPPGVDPWLDGLTFEQAGHLVDEVGPDVFHQRATALDTAAGRLGAVLDEVRREMTSVREAWTGQAADDFDAVVRAVTSKADSAVQAARSPGYGAVLRDAGDRLSNHQQRLGDLRAQRPSGSGRETADQVHTDSAKQIVRDLRTAYWDVGNLLTPLPYDRDQQPSGGEPLPTPHPPATAHGGTPAEFGQLAAVPPGWSSGGHHEQGWGGPAPGHAPAAFAAAGAPDLLPAALGKPVPGAPGRLVPGPEPVQGAVAEVAFALGRPPARTAAAPRARRTTAAPGIRTTVDGVPASGTAAADTAELAVAPADAARDVQDVSVSHTVELGPDQRGTFVSGVATAGGFVSHVPGEPLTAAAGGGAGQQPGGMPMMPMMGGMGMGGMSGMGGQQSHQGGRMSAMPSESRPDIWAPAAGTSAVLGKREPQRESEPCESKPLSKEEIHAQLAERLGDGFADLQRLTGRRPDK